MKFKRCQVKFNALFPAGYFQDEDKTNLMKTEKMKENTRKRSHMLFPPMTEKARKVCPKVQSLEYLLKGQPRIICPEELSRGTRRRSVSPLV